jgi:hypothetical protein
MQLATRPAPPPPRPPVQTGQTGKGSSGGTAPVKTALPKEEAPCANPHDPMCFHIP